MVLEQSRRLKEKIMDLKQNRRLKVAPGNRHKSENKVPDLEITTPQSMPIDLDPSINKHTQWMASECKR